MVAATVEGVVLAAHVVAGFVALLGGAVALLTEKGGRRHRLGGGAYVYSMAFVSGSALALFALDPTRIRQFLALVAVFSFYFAFSGYRFLSRKRPDDGPDPVDWAAAGLVVVVGVGLLAMGGTWLYGGATFGVVLVVFGGISTAFGGQDLRRFRRGGGEGREWFYGHLVRMSAGYVATVTAFATVNFTFVPAIVRWLGPTAVGTPLITYAVRRYQRKFGDD